MTDCNIKKDSLPFGFVHYICVILFPYNNVTTFCNHLQDNNEVGKYDPNFRCVEIKALYCLNIGNQIDYRVGVADG